MFLYSYSSYSSVFDFYETFFTTYALVSGLVGLAVSIGCGFVSKSINESKGYYGGFAWGFFLGVIGIIVVACKSQAYVPTYNPNPYNAPQNNSNAATPAGSWRCTCGRPHPAYESSCVCGRNKSGGSITPPKVESSTSVAAVKAQLAKKAEEEAVQAEVAANNAVDEESKKLELLKEYKGLLDSGIITQEDFDAKKKQLLS